MVMGMVLKAIADIYKIQINDAANFLRNNPLLGNEVHINEELANLEEAVKTYWHSDLAFKKQHPSLHKYLAVERYAALKHTIGMILRMIRGQQLPFAYDIHDCEYALRKLARLAVYELQATGHKVDRRTLGRLQPLLGLRQRWSTGDNLLPGNYGTLLGRVRRLPVQPLTYAD